MLTMYDTITVETVPPNPQAVAGYVAGSWPTYNALVQKFPDAHHLSISPFASKDADCLDVEPGDATPSQAAPWVRRQQARGIKKPVLYTSVSGAMALLADLQHAGIGRASVRLWTAHYTFHPHLCGPACGFGMNTLADATQWTDKALGRNLDASLCQDTFFAPPADPNHYGWFDMKPRVFFGLGATEREVVKAYDLLRPQANASPTRLGVLRVQAFLLAGRLRTLGDSGMYHRDWRRQQLTLRAKGQRVV